MKSQLAAIILSVHIYCEFCFFSYIKARNVSRNVQIRSVDTYKSKQI